MADSKKYYWLKLRKDFFKREDIQLIKSMPDGAELVMLYVQLLLQGVDRDGVLMVNDRIAHTAKTLALVLDVEENTVNEAISIFEAFGLLIRCDDGTFFMTELSDMVGCESKWAEYKRKKAETDVSSLENFQSESKIIPTDIEIDLEKEKEKEKEKYSNIKRERKKENAPEARAHSPSDKGNDFVLKNKYGSYGWIELSDREYAQLLAELGEAELARCIAYIDQSAQSTGNRNRWQDWGLILRRCSRESWGIRQEKSAPKQGTETIGWHGADYDEAECTPEEKAAAAAELDKMKAYLAKLKERDNGQSG